METHAETDSGVVGQEAVGRTRVLVVDDHRTFAELLAWALDGEPDLVCVGHAQTSAAAVEAACRLAPDIVVMDLQLPDRDGISTAAELTERDPDLKVLILTGHASAAELARAGAAGVCGFLAKGGSLDDVLDALRHARRGSLILPPQVLAAFSAPMVPKPAPPQSTLTQRELDVLRLLGQGRDPRGISKELGITLYACRANVKSILAKLQVHSQLEAVIAGSRAGLIRIGG